MRQLLKAFFLVGTAVACLPPVNVISAELPRPGATASEVRAKMGAPTSVRSAADTQIWEYAGKLSPYETYFLVFSKGRLASTRQVINDETFASVKTGMSEAQVRSLLGSPWRITNVNDDADSDIGDVWEYRGRDAARAYKFHIEFDPRRRVVAAAKVADTASN